MPDSFHTTKRSSNMKVLIQTNERPTKRFMLKFSKSITRDEVRKIVDKNDDSALRLLIARSAEMTEVSYTQNTYPHADFVVNPNSYTLERLA